MSNETLEAADSVGFARAGLSVGENSAHTATPCPWNERVHQATVNRIGGIAWGENLVYEEAG